MKDNLTYKDSGVDYSAMDPFKVACQKAALQTSENATRFGVTAVDWTRGESAFALRVPAGVLSHVQEGLGTKNLVADAMYKLSGKSYYNTVTQDTVAMIVNDMITLQLFPVCVAMHLAAGHSDWFKDDQRSQDLIDGWKHACDLARCIWGGGETPTLKGIVYPETVELSGSGIGWYHHLTSPELNIGDAIILLESSGIHANGLTSARDIADKLPDGYLTRLSDGRTYGESLLDPTHIYVRGIEDLKNKGLRINYAVNITGHGWRKLMRLRESYTYHLHTIFPSRPIFDFLQQHGPINDEEAYGNFNMGAGFALFVSRRDAESAVDFINNGNYGYKALLGGTVMEGEKKVIIEPKNLTYHGDTLEVR